MLHKTYQNTYFHDINRAQRTLILQSQTVRKLCHSISSTMELKILVLTATLAVVHGGIVGPIGPPPPIGVPAIQTRIEPIDPHPRYAFGYDVNDYITGDSKNHQEVRDGDVVRGAYSLSDPDGTRRIVTYSADPLTGFNAIVQKTPLHLGPGPIGHP